LADYEVVDDIRMSLVPAARRRRKLAVLASHTAVVSPSSFSTLRHFAAIAAKRGLEASLIGYEDLARLAEFDGLFVRQTTAIGGIAHRFAMRASALGVPVLDDPISIVRGSDKLVQHHLMAARDVPMPRTRIVASAGDISDAVDALGLPLVLKIRDGCYCRGVEKAETVSQGEQIATRMLAFSASIVAQEYLPTPYDWRVGILAGSPLFACKYHMVHGHWQVVARGPRGSLINGEVEAVALHRVPANVVELALRAASCIGSGLYGVDIKETGRGPAVIEVNDNPDMDVDAETVANPEAWDRLATWFAAAMVAAGCRRSQALAAVAS